MHATVAAIPRTRAAAALVALALVVAGLTLPGRAARASLSVPNASALSSTGDVRTGLALPSALLPPSTACSGSAPVVCELWAKPGTLALSGTTVPVWGFADSAAGAASTPGPALTVPEDQSVRLKVHNGLPDALALTVPGAASSGSAGDDTAGVAPGGVVTYDFTAPDPGTYLYEAGHTAMGPRQVAMGLVGALVVRPTTFGVGNQTLDGDAATEFDDEGVLVLTEVDPAFNAAPATYNLKAFHPTHRLINGQEFPNTGGIATDHGRRTLLRFVNGGVLGHSMGVLGVKETILAINAKASSDRPALVADMIAAGQTEDALVAFPAAGADRLPVYETAGTLDNAGQPVGTTRIVGFGGLLTFLVAGSVAGGGNVGPATSGVAVSPDPATPAASATVTATASDAATGGSNVAQAEFVVDTSNVALGSGAPMSAVDGTFDEVTEPVTGTLSAAVLSTLTQGTHVMYVRAQDSDGVWGSASSTSFRVGNTGPVTSGVTLAPNPVNSGTVQLSATGDDSAIGGTVTGGEYFVDPATTPVGNGTGTALTIATPATVAVGTAAIGTAVISGLLPGSHTVYVHFRDSSNLWGPTVTTTLTIDRTGPAVGLGPNQVTPAVTDGTIGSSTDPTSLKVHATFVDTTSKVVAAEGFLDTAGANGGGFTFLADDGSWSTLSEAGYGLIPLSQLTGLADGTHHVYAHGKDAAGNWGPFADLTFVLDRGPKATGSSAGSFSLLAGPQTLATATALTGSTLTAAEMFRGTDPGAGNGSSLVVNPAGSTTASLVVEPRSLGVLSNQLVWVRAKDSNGIWGKAVGVTVTVTGLFGDGFESGSTGAWSSVTGATRQAVLKAAAIDGTWGLRVTALGTNTSFVQRNVSNSSTTLHLAAKIDAQTYASGTSTTALVTVMQAATNTAQVAAVQLRNGPSGRQVRLVVGNGAGASAGAWVTLTAGVHEIRIDRTASAGTRPTSFRLDGVLVGTALTNGTATATVFRTGVVTATGTSNTGLLYLDSFGATT